MIVGLCICQLVLNHLEPYGLVAHLTPYSADGHVCCKPLVQSPMVMQLLLQIEQESSGDGLPDPWDETVLSAGYCCHHQAPRKSIVHVRVEWHSTGRNQWLQRAY
jgi:hypothetical protein